MRDMRGVLRRSRDWLAGTLFIGPALVALGLIAVVPLMYAIFSSLHSWHFHRPALREFVGLGNFAELLSDSRYLNSLSVTTGYTLLSVTATMILGFLLALLLKEPFPGRNLVRALLTIPMIMTPVVSTLVWKTFFFEADLGLINWLLAQLGIRGPAWVATSPYAFFTLVIVNIWFMTPFVFLIMDAALAGFPRDVLDAAEIDGASYWQRVLYVIVPMLRGTIMFTLIFRITIDFREFDIIHVMTRGGPAFDTQVLSLWVYNTALRNFQVGYANAGAVLMMGMVAAVCLALLIIGLRGIAGRLGSR
jgi:multiple sugar transport system permease protein